MGLRNVGKSISLMIAVTVFLFGMDVVNVNAQSKSGEDYLSAAFVKKIEFTGNTLIKTEALQGLTEEFINRELTLEDMNSVADVITMFYQEKGYILAKAYVPEQKIEDGVLKIAVIEGRTGKIKVSGQKFYDERVLKRYFQPQLKHGFVKESLLERGLLLTNDLPSAETKVVLRKGEKPGTADLVLNTKDKDSVKFGIDYNNFGHELISKNRYGINFELTDPQWGCTLSLRGVTGNDSDDSTLGTANLSIPVNTHGTKVFVRYLKANYALGQEMADLGLEGDTKIYGGGISHPILRERNRNLNLTVGYDYKYTQNFILDEKISIDELDVYYITLDFDNLDRFLGKNILSLGCYHGVLRIDEKVPPGRDAQDADRKFDRYSVDVARIQRIYGHTNLMLRVSGRLSESRLMPIEQMVIGGYGTVRGHEPSLFLGDSGYTISGELMFAPPHLADKVILGQRVAQMVQLALFYDHGGVYTAEPKSGEDESGFLTGYGAGIRLFYKDIFRLKFDVAFPKKERTPNEDKVFYYLMASINF